MAQENEKRKLPVVALVGRPNVGKSTLFNRLTGTRNALVDRTPGLTRDRRYSLVKLQGREVELVDTAGLSAGIGDDLLGPQVRQQTLKAMGQADCLCLLFDARDGLHPDDLEIIELARRSFKPWMAVINKVENEETRNAVLEFFETGIGDFIPISAKTGYGMEVLVDKLARMCPETGELPASREDTGEAGETVIRVCLTGKPNVGKSSIMNRLIGQERMVVSDIPGTTRDSIDCLFQRKDSPDIVFVDTAGIRKRSRVKHRVEKFSVLKAMESIRTCDVSVCVFDASEGITEQDRRLAGYTRDYAKGCITIFNKWDLVKEDRKLRKLLNGEAKLLRKMIPYAPHLNVSAVTGKNIKKVFPLIDQVYGDFSFKESTGRLNRILKQALLRRNPPVTKGHFLKIFYVTQTGTRPPVLTFFANYPKLFPEHYRRFLENFFRQELGIAHTPIRIVLRER